MLREHAGKLVAISSFRETDPVGYTAQPKFINAVAGIETELPPEKLMETLLVIERELGRDRAATVPKGPRTIDLDLLLYDDRIIHAPGLTVPHPAMHERRFVLTARRLEHEPLDRARMWLALGALAMFVLCFTPNPMEFLSGR